MRKPKAPAGFVPVDSEEARKIDGKTIVNCIYVSNDGGWYTIDNMLMSYARCSMARSLQHLHVQLPPAVEWEEVWGWDVYAHGTMYITKDGIPYESIMNRSWTESHLDTIVRALNEMEESNG